jgi:hypothetical protein
MCDAIRRREIQGGSGGLYMLRIDLRYVSANDSVVAPATLESVVVVTPPWNGTAVPLGVASGIVTYTPTTGVVGPAATSTSSSIRRARAPTSPP